MSEPLPDNGLPLEAQPWARRIEAALRKENTARSILATNSQRALAAAGRAVTAAATIRTTQVHDHIISERIPATPLLENIEATASAYFDSAGAPRGRLDFNITPVNLDVDGNVLPVSFYRVWVRETPPEAEDPNYELVASSPVPLFFVPNLSPDTEYQIRVSVIGDQGNESERSEMIELTTPAELPAMGEPSTPTLFSVRGLLVVRWDGGLVEGAVPSQFRAVYAEVGPAGADEWERRGQPLTEEGDIHITGLPVGEEYDVRLVGVDSLGGLTDPSTTESVVIIGVSGPDIEANSVTANEIAAGTITVNELSADVGQNLNLTSNSSVTIIAGQISDLSDAQGATDDNLAEMQTFYQFGPEGATIASPTSPFSLSLEPERIAIMLGGNPVSWWNSGQMVVPSFVGEEVVIGNHKFEKYGTGSVMRAL